MHIKNNVTLKVLMSFFVGVTAMNFFGLTFSHGDKYELITASSYFNLCDNSFCKDHFRTFGKVDVPQTKSIQVFNMPNLKCLASNEDPNSKVLCFRKDGNLLFTYGRLGEEVSIVYKGGNVLSMADSDSDGEVDWLSYDGIDDLGRMVRLVKDVDLDGVLDEVFEISE